MTTDKSIQGYAFEFCNGSVFTPDGQCADGMTRADVDAVNRETERKEMEALKAHPDKIMLYAKLDARNSGNVHTWLGTIIDPWAQFGDRRYVGFGRHTYRRAITCTIFGQAYHGWFMESSGDYVRLTKSKSKASK